VQDARDEDDYNESHIITAKRALKVQISENICIYTYGDNDIICYYSLWSLLPTPCCRAGNSKQH